MASGALGGQEGAILLQVGADQEPHGGVTAAVVRPGLLPMAVSATPGEACSQAGRARQSWYAGRASGRVLSGAWLPAQVALRRGRSRRSSRWTSFLALAAAGELERGICSYEATPS